MRRRLVCAAAGAAAIVVLSAAGSRSAVAGSGDTTPPVTTAPVAGASPTVPSESTTPPVTIAVPDPLAGLPPSAPLVGIPEGCAAPPVAGVVFVGRLVAADSTTGRFRIEHIRAGSADAFRVGNLVDVRYGRDVDLLRVDEDYLVGAVGAGALGAGSRPMLTSKVRAEEPLLGGNAIIGLTEKAGDCPSLEDPVRTFRTDGSEIDAGLLDGLSTKKRSILLAFVKPAIVALLIVLGLVLVRWVITAYALGVRRIAENPEYGRVPRE